MAITLNANFTAENEKAVNDPVILVKIPNTISDTKKDGTWGTNVSEANVDYSSGSPQIATAFGPSYEDTIQYAGTDYLDLYYLHGIVGFIQSNVLWQKFSHKTAASTYTLATLYLEAYYYKGAADPYPRIDVEVYEEFNTGAPITTGSNIFNIAHAQGTDLDYGIDVTNVTVNTNQEYWVKIWSTFVPVSGNGSRVKLKRTSKSYPKGALHQYQSHYVLGNDWFYY